MLNKTILATLAALLAAPALADTRLQYVDERNGAQQTVITIKDGKVRMDNADSSAWTLYDSASNTLTTIDQKEKTYTVLDEETMKAMSAQVSSAMAEMKRQLDAMPPEQRAMMEKMMGGAMDMGKKMVETKVERTGRKLEKAGYDCEQVFYSVGNMMRSEMCVTDVDNLDIPSGDRKALDAMQAHMKAMAESMSESFGVDFALDFDSMGGMPVYMKEDKEPSGEILKDVSHDDVDASQLQVPKGYREEKIEAGK